MIGLGHGRKHGATADGGHKVVGYDPAETARALEKNGAQTTATLDKWSATQGTARDWLMVPAGEITDGTITNLVLC
jgi:6-phosphogluconate dehydrogenase